MNDFVDECRREWKRLGVPEPVANEMAVDLTADIADAEADGGSAESVLGDGFFDARRFAASWAGARGVISVEAPAPDRSHRRPAALILVLVATVSALGALVLAIGRHSSSSSITSPGFPPHPLAPVIQSMNFGPQLTGPHHVLYAVAVLVMMLVASGLLAAAVILWWPRQRATRPGWGRD